MNWDQIAGNWRTFQGHAEQYWGEISGDEFARLTGERDQLIGKIQAAYGVTREEAERQVRDFAAQMKKHDPSS